MRDSTDLDKKILRKPSTKLFYNYMKEVAGVSNHNLVRNSHAHLNDGAKTEPDHDFCWIDKSQIEAQQKCQLTY